MRPTPEPGMLPVTTTSAEARQNFESGRHAAFYYQPSQAWMYLDAAIAADPGFVLAYLHRGGMSTTLDRKRYFDLAQANRESVTEDEQKMVDAFFAFLWEDEAERAVVIFHDLADRYPDDPYLPSYLGLRYLWNLGRPDEAKEQFLRALERDATFGQAHHWLGYVAMQQGDYAGAEEAFRRCIELAPDQPRPYDSLGRLLLEVGRREEASEQFEQALSLDPDFLASRQNLVRLEVHAANRRFQEACQNRDFAALGAAYAQTAQLLLPGHEELQGSSAIADHWRLRLEDGMSGVELKTSEILLGATGDVATELGRYGVTTTDGNGETGTYVAIWQHTPKGWKIDRALWASQQPSSR
jgi:tetratricopeptide (TPR) repeat protein